MTRDAAVFFLYSNDIFLVNFLNFFFYIIENLRGNATETKPTLIVCSQEAPHPLITRDAAVFFYIVSDTVPLWTHNLKLLHILNFGFLPLRHVSR